MNGIMVNGDENGTSEPSSNPIQGYLCSFHANVLGKGRNLLLLHYL